MRISEEREGQRERKGREKSDILGDVGPEDSLELRVRVFGLARRCHRQSGHKGAVSASKISIKGGEEKETTSKISGTHLVWPSASLHSCCCADSDSRRHRLCPTPPFSSSPNPPPFPARFSARPGSVLPAPRGSSSSLAPTGAFSLPLPPLDALRLTATGSSSSNVRFLDCRFDAAGPLKVRDDLRVVVEVSGGADDWERWVV